MVKKSSGVAPSLPWLFEVTPGSKPLPAEHHGRLSWLSAPLSTIKGNDLPAIEHSARHTERGLLPKLVGMPSVGGTGVWSSSTRGTLVPG